MSQDLLPSGMAQPHRLQTAMCGVSGRAAGTYVTIVQQNLSRPLRVRRCEGAAQKKPAGTRRRATTWRLAALDFLQASGSIIPHIGVDLAPVGIRGRLAGHLDLCCGVSLVRASAILASSVQP
jgi:hypothetical protein